jgi:DNA-binding transcriptional LysR family regulator
MDVTLARTFLAISDGGSFKAAAEHLNVTQSTISLRVKTLESLLGRSLFERGKSGAALTPAGQQFQRHAIAMLRVWQHARLDVALSDEHSDHLAVGGQVSVWDGFLLPWVAQLRSEYPKIAVTASTATSGILVERIAEGTLDLAVVYRAQARPGLTIEHIFDDELVLVTGTGEPEKEPGENYVYVNWGPEFAADHADAYPELDTPGLQFELGALAISYLFDYRASGYFPMRVAKPHIEESRLEIVKRARRFVYPVFAVYAEDHDDDAFVPLLQSLRARANVVAQISS